MKSVSFVNRLILLPSAIVLLILAGSNVGIAEMIETTTQELEALIEQEVPVIDVRTPGEWRTTGIIPGSHLLTFFDERGNYNIDDWLTKLTEIAQPDDRLVIVCEVGNRSRMISNFLSSQLGYREVHNATQGMQQWRNQGFPVQQWP